MHRVLTCARLQNLLLDRRDTFLQVNVLVLEVGVAVCDFKASKQIRRTRVNVLEGQSG